jgi:hypothetical protein
MSKQDAREKEDWASKTIQVDAETYNQIVEWADKHHRTIGGQVTAAMETYIGKRDPKQ